MKKIKNKKTRLSKAELRNKKVKEGFFKRNYHESWNYIKDSRRFIYSIIIIFFLFTLLGFIVQPSPAIEEKILEFIEELLEKTQGMSQSELIGFILANNAQSSFTGLFFGIVLGIFPLLSTLANGYILGFVASRVSDVNGLLVLWRLLPHGIFELPALFISLGLGLKLGTFVFKKDKLKTLKKYLIESFRVFLFIVAPLLIIAAIIEGSLIYLLG
jgi:stage II sporulation protein M